MKNLFAAFQTGHDVIGDYANTPEQARRSALDYTRMNADTAESIRTARVADRPSNINGEITIVPVSSIAD